MKIILISTIIVAFCSCIKEDSPHIPPLPGHCVITETFWSGSIYTLKNDVIYCIKDTLYGQPTYEMGAFLTAPGTDTIFTKIQLSNIRYKSTFSATTIASSQNSFPNCYFFNGVKHDTYSSYQTVLDYIPNAIAIAGSVTITSVSPTYISGTYTTLMSDSLHHVQNMTGTFEATFYP